MSNTLENYQVWNGSVSGYLEKDMSNHVQMARDEQCNSDKYYYTGSECLHRPLDDYDIACDSASGYLAKENNCVSPTIGCGENYKADNGICYRIRYTPAEAAEVVGETNTIFLYYK